ncbi:SCO4225 family membrane protein [Streptomyces sp. NPDC007088]|uniref:SCO4225 family membrane protein n=1 Tax=Streptomyces sp. NPDC007088 TaxID=3364773 RepID=UPI0036B2FF32
MPSTSTSTSGNTRRPLHRIMTAATDNWFSRGYLLVFAAALTWFGVDTLFVYHPDASFAGVWPMFLTLPTSLLLLIWSGLPGWALVIGLVPAALVNATLLGLFVRVMGPAGHRRPGPQLGRGH